MARITKKDLQERLQAAIRHQEMPLKFISKYDEIDVRDEIDFLSCEKYYYSGGVVPLQGEIGKTKAYRYIVRD